MNPKTIRLVRKSWTAARPTSIEAIELFYKHLADFDPSLKNKFRGILHVLDVAVNQLGYMNGLKQVLRNIGERHAEHGVQPTDYSIIGCALLMVLGHRLGSGFTEELREAWIEVYGMLVCEMAGEVIEAA